MKIKSPKDFWAGLMFIGFGLFFLVVAGNYQMGSAVRMGPAYFPTVLGGIMAVLGAIVLFQSLTIQGGPMPQFSFKPIFFISLALILFGYLLKPIGFVLALVVLVFVSAFGGHEFRAKEVAILAVVLIVFSVLAFVKGLTLPFPLWPDFMS
ncbi:MAG: tripartite tricarboxylate transporter TctB family protein [Betaproteobacteria bacterium]